MLLNETGICSIAVKERCHPSIARKTTKLYLILSELKSSFIFQVFTLLSIIYLISRKEYALLPEN